MKGTVVVSVYTLMKQPKGTLFYEDDNPYTPLLIESPTTDGNDLLVTPLTWENHDAGSRRMGFDEMDECDLASMEFVIPCQTELADMAEKITMAINARREIEKVGVSE